MERIGDLEQLRALRDSLVAKLDPNQRRVRICMTGCRAHGAEQARDAFAAEVKKQDLGNVVEIRETGCHGFCSCAPVVAIDPQGIFYPQVTPEDVPEIVSQTLGNGTIVERLLYEDAQSGKRIAYERDVPFYRAQQKNVLSNCGIIDPKSILHYIARGGYSALEKALFNIRPEEIVTEVTRSGLRGRGGAGFPTGRKWSFVRASPGDVKYLVCNADEGDPGAFMDRAILEGDPHSVLEGMIIAADAVGATQGYVYCRAEKPIAIEHLKIALSQAEELGLVGENILGSGLTFDIRIKEGAGAFVCGEETALLASIEGKRGMPRPRPPFPAQSGLWGKPTLINNVETYSNVPLIINRGADWYASLGTEQSKGTKIFALAGKVNNTGLVEVPVGIPIRKVVFDIGGGVPRGRKFKAVQMGGPSGGCVPEEHLDLPVDYGSLESIGAIMGSGGMVVMDDSTCMVDLARFFLAFVQAESCGKCTPCRIGTKRMLEILTRITQGKGTEDDIALVTELAQGVKDTSLCGLGQTAPNPVLSTLKYFRDEYDAHIREHRCPAAACTALVYAPCEHVCPINQDAVGYVALIGEGRFEEALSLVRDRNPLAGVCGRVCHHPCEEKCRRGDVDQPVAIAALKRAAADYGVAKGIKTRVKVAAQRTEKVAVVGSGPAGLNAAYHLARKGYPVTVFEALPVAGGMLSVGIPEYRLPRKVLQADIDFITSLGVEIRVNSPLGDGVTLDSLFQEGYKAVLLAIGAHRGLKLGIQGEDLKGVFDGVSFLRDVNLGKKVKAGKRVAVIGGGNVALDAARSSLRLGATEVSIVYRRSRDQMPANKEEIVEAEHEGIRFLYLTAPVRIPGNNGRVTGLECLRTELGEYDSSGRRRPVPVKGSEFLLDVDTVIAAIGQEPETAWLPTGNGLETRKDSTLAVDPVTLATKRAGVFAAGDDVTGPATVTEAMASGERAAVSIDRFVCGQDIKADRFLVKKTPLEIPFSEDAVERGPREELPAQPVASRVAVFEEVNRGFPEEAAIRQARRCLRCDLKE